jgi:tetratricopeptide (TPR) repeat protein
MNRSFFGLRGLMMLMILVILLALGCAALPTKPSEKALEKDSFSVFPERYRKQALEYEKNGELPRVLQCWEIVNAFQPADEEVNKKIATLKTQIHILADQHFKKGISYYQSRSIPIARKEFLITLYYEPEHREALSYIKNRLNEEDYLRYEVAPQDTLKEIARKVYRDPQKDFLIAYFNDLGKDPKLTPRKILRLPLLDLSSQPATPATDIQEAPPSPKELIAVPKDRKAMMDKAFAYFKVNKFKETVSITEEILLADPSNKAARDLTNASNYQMGKVLQQQKKYEEALEQFDRVEPGYRDVSDLIASTKGQLAETHYVLGIRYFTEEKLDRAIQEWEETLRLNPRHPKARADIENTSKLLQKLKEIK